MRWWSSFSFERRRHLRWGSITVSGSSSMIAFTSERTRPRPSEIFCLPSAVRPDARERQHRSEIEQLRDLAHPGVHARLGHPAVAQREREIVVDGHRVVDDRELEHLRDVALVRRLLRHVRVAEEDPPRGRPEEARHDVQQGRLAAAGGAEERVRAAVRPLEIDSLQRPVGVARRARRVAVPQLLEADAGHLSRRRHGRVLSAPGPRPGRSRGTGRRPARTAPSPPP